MGLRRASISIAIEGFREGVDCLGNQLRPSFDLVETGIGHSFMVDSGGTVFVSHGLDFVDARIGRRSPRVDVGHQRHLVVGGDVKPCPIATRLRALFAMRAPAALACSASVAVVVSSVSNAHLDFVSSNVGGRLGKRQVWSRMENQLEEALDCRNEVAVAA